MPPPRNLQPATRHPFRPTDPLLLALLAAVLLPAALSVEAAGWVNYLDRVPILTLGGMLAGYLVARTRLPGVLAHPLAVGLGIEALAYAFSRVPATGTLSERVEWLSGRLGAWLQAALSGGASNDPLLFALAMGALGWLLGHACAWLLFRGEAPWLAITSAGVALLMNLSYAPPALSGFVVPFVVASLLLVATHQAATQREEWLAARLRVDRGLTLRLLGGSGVAAGILLAAGWTLPVGPTSSLASSVWDRTAGPWQQLERDFDRLFAALQPSERAPRGLNFTHTLAPRGAFELGDAPVLEVRSPVPLYWRAATADTYLGTAMTTSPAGGELVPAEAPLLPPEKLPDGRRQVEANVRVLANRSVVAFAPEAPLRLSVPVHLDTRGGEPLDLASTRLESALLKDQQYQVVAAVANTSARQLRTAGEDYPAWVRQRYLAPLPAQTPARVVQKAREVTRGATNPYDRAVALERYLRDSLPYSTQVEPLPPGRDWADHVLFEADKAYCDYFATAMVVMLRGLGVPARVASGFAPGDLDRATGVWTIREHHAHSWVEVFFPRYGWITFEPSAIRPVPERVEGTPEPAPAPAPEAQGDIGQRSALNPDELAELQRLSGAAGPRGLLTLPGWASVSLAAAGLLATTLMFGSLGLLLAWRWGHGRLAWYQRPYAQLLRLARWFGLWRPRAAHTPFETADSLAREVPPAAPLIQDLARAYVEGTYAGRPPASDLWPAWSAARRELVRLLARRRIRQVARRLMAAGPPRG